MTERDRSSGNIVEVYKENFVEEIKRISNYVDEGFTFIGMDTEYPGIVYSVKNYSPDFYYRTVKLNVDALKLIQVGITLCNSEGEYPKGASTWQFNLNFNKETDKYSSSSLVMLQNCGIDFDVLESKGIPHCVFAEYLITSGLVLNPEVNWISFHGSYDFAYMLRLLLNTPLPITENEFTQELMIYFPNHFDIRILVQGNDSLKGGLNKLAQYLEVFRVGTTHQAGSDSNVTVDVYFKLSTKNLIDEEDIEARKNVLFGLGSGKDDNETLTYTQIGNCFFNPYLMPMNAPMISMSPTAIPFDVNGVIPSFMPSNALPVNKGNHQRERERKAKKMLQIPKKQGNSLTIL